MMAHSSDRSVLRDGGLLFRVGTHKTPWVVRRAHSPVCTQGGHAYMTCIIVTVFGLPMTSPLVARAESIMEGYPSAPTQGFVPGVASPLGMPWC